MAQVLIKLLNYLIKLLKSVGRFKETMLTCLLCRSFGKLIKEYNPCNILGPSIRSWQIHFITQSNYVIFTNLSTC
jgi:hypothetical protein